MMRRAVTARRIMLALCSPIKNKHTVTINII